MIRDKALIALGEGKGVEHQDEFGFWYRVNGRIYQTTEDDEVKMLPLNEDGWGLIAEQSLTDRAKQGTLDELADKQNRDSRGRLCHADGTLLSDNELSAMLDIPRERDKGPAVRPSPPLALDDKDIEIAGLKKQLAEAEGQRDRLNVQLAGCLAVAEGHVDSPCEPRAYGWSPAYEKTLWLRREVTELRAMLPALVDFRAGHSLREKVAELTEDLGKLKDRVGVVESLPRRFTSGPYIEPCKHDGDEVGSIYRQAAQEADLDHDVDRLREYVIRLNEFVHEGLVKRVAKLEERPQITYTGGPRMVPCDAPQDYPERHEGTGLPLPQDIDKGTGSPPPRQPGSVCESK
jgi:hypothetical protein